MGAGPGYLMAILTSRPGPDGRGTGHKSDPRDRD